jgi:hypothetical protein
MRLTPEARYLLLSSLLQRLAHNAEHPFRLAGPAVKEGDDSERIPVAGIERPKEENYVNQIFMQRYGTELLFYGQGRNHGGSDPESA